MSRVELTADVFVCVVMSESDESDGDKSGADKEASIQEVETREEGK